jgi:uncharacterized membrane protein
MSYTLYIIRIFVYHATTIYNASCNKLQIDSTYNEKKESSIRRGLASYGVRTGLSIIMMYPIFLSFGCNAILYASEVASSPIIKAKLMLFFVTEIYLDNRLENDVTIFASILPFTNLTIIVP